MYRCTRTDGVAPRELLFKIVRHSRDNDLLERETDALRTLVTENPAAAGYRPQLIDAFLSADATTRRRVLIFAIPPRAVPLSRIRTAYASGLDPRDAAWIFNRLLEGLWFTHQAGLVHGAILPPNLYADLEHHGLTLTDWAHSISNGRALVAISNLYESWYPREILAKASATFATDIFMAVRCLVYLLGGDPIAGAVPSSVPAALQRFIKGCLIPYPSRRPNDAGDLREEFDELLVRLYGKRAFRPLAIPA